MTSDVVQAASVVRHALGRFIDHLVVGDTTRVEVLEIADELENLMQVLRVTAGTMRHREAIPDEGA